MILVRDIFQVKFGKMKEARALLKENMKGDSGSANGHQRVLTDLTGQYYTLVMENTHKDLATYEAEMRKQMSQSSLNSWYPKFTALVDSGRREMFTVEEL